MKSTGIVRKVDQLGRFVLPSELRAKFDIKDDALEVFTSGDMIVLKKYNPSDIFTGDMEDLIDYMGKKVSKKNIRELARLAGFKIVEENPDEINEDPLFDEDEL
jgi:transcriptional pleiotropic regulator of transition state genes